MGSNPSTDKLLLYCGPYSRSCKDGNNMVDTQRNKKTIRWQNKAREDTET